MRWLLFLAFLGSNLCLFSKSCRFMWDTPYKSKEIQLGIYKEFNKELKVSFHVNARAIFLQLSTVELKQKKSNRDNDFFEIDSSSAFFESRKQIIFYLDNKDSISFKFDPAFYTTKTTEKAYGRGKKKKFQGRSFCRTGPLDSIYLSSLVLNKIIGCKVVGESKSHRSRTIGRLSDYAQCAIARASFLKNSVRYKKFLQTDSLLKGKELVVSDVELNGAYLGEQKVGGSKVKLYMLLRSIPSDLGWDDYEVCIATLRNGRVEALVGKVEYSIVTEDRITIKLELSPNPNGVYKGVLNYFQQELLKVNQIKKVVLKDNRGNTDFKGFKASNYFIGKI